MLNLLCMVKFIQYLNQWSGNLKMMKLKYLVIALFLIFIAACKPTTDQAGFSATDISGADFAKTFNLTDHTGKARTLEDFKGKVVALFFGYTHCPDVCPTTMTDLKQSMKLLGDDADEVQVIFITLDPERDTQYLLAQYVPGFDARFIGLYGTPEQTTAVSKEFKIFAAKVEIVARVAIPSTTAQACISMIKQETSDCMSITAPSQKC